MVVAQLVEPQIVILVVVGSSPIDHPNFKKWGSRIYRLAAFSQILRIRNTAAGSVRVLPTHFWPCFIDCALSRISV